MGIKYPATFISGNGKTSAGDGSFFTEFIGSSAQPTVFFVLVALAALTSSISLMETVVSIIMEKFHVKRIKASIITLIICFLLGMLSVLGYSAWKTVELFGMQFLDFLFFSVTIS